MTSRILALDCRKISRALLLLSLALTAALSSAQSRPASAPAASAPSLAAFTVINAAENHLWVADTDAQGTDLTQRTDQTLFDSPRHFGGRVVRIAALGTSAVLFFENGDVVQAPADGATSEPRPDMPQQKPPIDAVGVKGTVYALVDSHNARELPLASATGAEKFDPATADVCLITLSPQGWAGVAPCPNAVMVRDGDLQRPRVLALNGSLVVFWSEASGKVAWSELELPARTWHTPSSVDAKGLTGFVPLVLSRVPTIVVTTGSEGHENSKALRLLGGALDESVSSWVDSELQLSALPSAALNARITDAVGFNQHVALSVTDANGQRYLRFGRLGEAPIEKTATLQAVFELPLDEQFRALVQYASLAVMVVVIAMLFIFRRGATLRDPPLPPPWQPALHIQRLIGAAIDLVPFSIVAALWLQISWQDAVKAVLEWASPFSGTLPIARVLTWWGLTAAMYVTYSTIMELLISRTVGKALTGTRIRAYSGERPALWQRLVRNALRIAEVHPPFWLPLAMLFLLTRSHQRVGDLFAKTVVVRKGEIVTPPTETPAATPPSDPPAAEE